MSLGVRRMTFVTASTKRAVVTVGQHAEPVLFLPAVRCTPLDPVDDKTYERMRLETPHGLLQTFTDEASYDIRKGDVLHVDGIDYPIKDVGRWATRSGYFLALIVEELRI